MKRKVLSILALGFIFTSAAQTNQIFDYSNSTGWSGNIRNTYLSSSLPSGCTHTPGQLAASGDNVVFNTTSNRIDFNTVLGAQENRISYDLNAFYSQSFNVDFEFNFAGNTNPNLKGAGFLPIVLSSRDENPEMALPIPVGGTCKQAPNMDAICVFIGSPGATSLTDSAEASVRVWDDGSMIPGNVSTVKFAYGTTYYASLRVYDNEHGELFLYKNADRTLLKGRFCFSIPASVSRLKYLQHATCTLCGWTRVASGWIDNTRISIPTNDCCKMAISGPNIICDGASGTFNVTTKGKDVVVTTTLYDGSVIQPNLDGSYTISNWGLMNGQAPKQVTITATSICHCEEISVSMTVYVYPAISPLFDLINFSTSGNNINQFSCVSPVNASNVLHEWQMFYGTSNAMGTSVRGPFNQAGLAGATWVIDPTLTPILQTTSSPYVIRHRVSYTDGTCEPAEYFRSIELSNKTGMMIDLGDVTGMTDAQVKLRKEEIEERILNGQNISIQPNPTDGKVTVKATANIVQVVVLDANGRELTKVTGNGNELLVDLSAMTKGTYLFKITTANGTYTERVVRQ